MPREFVLPDLGEGIAEAQIVRVLVNDGDVIKEDQYLMEVETDKAAVEIPSPYAGVAKHIHVKAGQTVNVGDVIVTFDDDGAGDTAAPKQASKTTAAAPAAKQTAATVRSAGAGVANAPAAANTPAAAVAAPPPRRTTASAAPSVRKLARERGVDLDQITGSGPGGRITKEDVERAAGGAGGGGAATGTPAAPAFAGIGTGVTKAAPLPGVPDTDKWGKIRREPLSQIRKTIANQMTRSAFTAVHVTHSDDADLTRLAEMRTRLNELTGNTPKLTVMSFVIRAVSAAVRKFPSFNASFDDENGEIIYKEYVNIGIAVDTERGLIVPVIRDADRLSLAEIATALRTIADRVRTNQFAVEDLRGGTFTITNVGALGGTINTPIINYPEVAILGLGRSRQVPVIRDGNVTGALVLPLNLSFDHRATDGANAARFTREIIGYLETPERFLLDR